MGIVWKMEEVAITALTVFVGNGFVQYAGA